MLLFCLFALVLSVVFGSISFLLMYVIEDSFIDREIKQEAAYLVDQYQQTGKWPTPQRPNMQIHLSRDTFPEDIRDIAIEEPMRKEFYGEQGRHFHVHAIPAFPNTFIVAEVSDELMVRQMRDGVIQFLSISSLFVTAIACLVAWLIARKTTKPLQQLAELVDGVAPEQIPKGFAAHYPNNEVGVLAHKLDDSLSRITSALEREKAFTRDASHELRTPLAVIKNAAELCMSQQNSNVDNVALTRIYEAADQMEKTVHTLLLLAREDHSGSQKHAMQLMPLIEKSILDNRLLLENKSVEIVLEDSCNQQITAEPNMVKVLLDNLLSNAFKYTESGEVNIRFQNQRLIINDSGPGISPDISDRITEVGVKGQQSTGFGFGLAIVKRLCEHQGWTLNVQSGQGTTVTVAFAN